MCCVFYQLLNLLTGNVLRTLGNRTFSTYRWLNGNISKTFRMHLDGLISHLIQSVKRVCEKLWNCLWFSLIRLDSSLTHWIVSGGCLHQNSSRILYNTENTKSTRWGGYLPTVHFRKQNVFYHLSAIKQMCSAHSACERLYAILQVNTIYTLTFYP